jgi:hypothetical protein
VPPVRASRLAAVLAVAVAYGVLAVWVTWPLALAWRDHLVALDPARAGDTALLGEADHLLNLWILSWVQHALTTAPARLFDANIFHPLPDALATGEHMLGAWPWFAPAYVATGSPTAGANALVLASFVVGGLGAWWLVADLTGRRLAGFAAGLVFAFAPWRLFWLVHLQLVGVHLFPFVLLFLHRAATRGRARDLAGFAVALGLQSLTSYYLAYMCAVLCAGALVYLPLGRRPAPGAWGRLARLVATGLAVALAVGVLSLPYLRQAAAGVVPSSQRLGWLEIASLAPGQLVAAGSPMRLGWLVLGLAVLGAWPRPGLGRFQALAAVVAAGGLVLAFGPRAGGHELPWAWLGRIVPGFGTMRVPGRFLILATAGLAALAGLGVARLQDAAARRPRGACVVGALAIAALLATYVPRHGEHRLLAVEPLDRASPAYPWLATHGEGRALFELPIGLGYGIAAEHARAEYHSILHWLPLLNGYNGYQPPLIGLYDDLGRRLPAPDALAALVDAVDVHWLLVHPGEATAGRWNPPIDGLEIVGLFGGDRLFRVTREPAAGTRGHLLAPGPETTTFAGLPLARVPPAGRAAEVRLRLDGDAPLAPRARVPLTAVVRNAGAVAWPCFAVSTDDTVGLWLQWRHAGRAAAGPAWQVRILRDLAPGETLETAPWVLAPTEPGRYVLHAEVGQGFVTDPGRWRAGGAEVGVSVAE